MSDLTLKKQYSSEEKYFTLEKSLEIKENHRKNMKSLSIDEKIKRIESLRERLKPIKKWKKSSI